jgi:hypothetical protein
VEGGGFPAPLRSHFQVSSMSPTKHLIPHFLLFSITTLICSFAGAQENPPASSSEVTVMNTLFGKQRLAGEDVVFFTNNDVLRGEVTSELLHLTTPYADILIPLRKCAGAAFEDTDKAGETIITVNANRMRGIITDRFINFRLAGAGAEVPIRKEKIRYILLRKSPVELGYLNSPAATDSFVMSNGDVLTGKVIEPTLMVRTDLAEVSTSLSDVENISFPGTTSGAITLRKKSGEQISGFLQTEDFSIQMDVGIRLDAVSKDRFAKFSSGDGLKVALAQLGMSSPSLPELPSEEEEPFPLPQAPLPSPTATETPLPTATMTPTLTATVSPTPTPSGPVSNVFESKEHGFRIERPSNSWRIITDEKELKELNEGAVVVFESAENVYSMVIVEHLPQVKFDDYVGAVSPALENVELLSDERGTLTGLTARKRVWRGSSNGLPFRFFYTLVEKGDDRIQIVSWCAEATLTESLVKQINAIEDSFGPYEPPPAAPKNRPRGIPPKSGAGGTIPPR